MNFEEEIVGIDLNLTEWVKIEESFDEGLILDLILEGIFVDGYHLTPTNDTP